MCGCGDQSIPTVCCKNKNRKDVEVAADMPITQASPHSSPLLLPLFWHGETWPFGPGANLVGSRPVQLDPADLILVLAAVAGWLLCVTLAQSRTQYRYVPCGPDYQGTV